MDFFHTRQVLLCFVYIKTAPSKLCPPSISSSSSSLTCDSGLYRTRLRFRLSRSWPSSAWLREAELWMDLCPRQTRWFLEGFGSVADNGCFCDWMLENSTSILWTRYGRNHLWTKPFESITIMCITDQSPDLALNIWQKTSSPFTTNALSLGSIWNPTSWYVHPVQVMMAGHKPYVTSMISASRSWNWWAACVKRSVCCLCQALLMLADLTSLSVIQKLRWDLPVLWNAGAPFLVRIS